MCTKIFDSGLELECLPTYMVDGSPFAQPVARMYEAAAIDVVGIAPYTHVSQTLLLHVKISMVFIICHFLLIDLAPLATRSTKSHFEILFRYQAHAILKAPSRLCLRLDGILPLGEMHLPLLLLLSDSAGVLLAQSPSDGTGLLDSEVERQVLLALVEETELVALVGVDDGQGTGDRFAEVVSMLDSC